MTFFLLGDLSNSLLGFLMGFLSLFLIMLILIQRGKGGGLTGALGGPGGQSAFGSKAGDTFTVVTIVVASIWGFTCAFAMWLNVPPMLDTNLMTDETTVGQGPGGEQDPEPPVTTEESGAANNSGLSGALTLGGTDPATPDPATPDPATPDPATPDPATPDPAAAPTATEASGGDTAESTEEVGDVPATEAVGDEGTPNEN